MCACVCVRVCGGAGCGCVTGPSFSVARRGGGGAAAGGRAAARGRQGDAALIDGASLPAASLRLDSFHSTGCVV